MNEIKTFKQDYESVQKYSYDDGSEQTVKYRLMKSLVDQGGTNMLDAIVKSAEDLNEEAFDYPDYASALYFVGDGGDTQGNGTRIKQFLEETDNQQGFGDHMRSALLLGRESEREQLASIFGEESTTVVPDLDQLIEMSMEKFDDDLENYLGGKTN